MMYFDCCAEVGPRHCKDPVAPWSSDDLLRWLDHCGIDGALVVHTLSYQGDPLRARALLDRDLAAAPDRLFPVWVVLPPDAGDFEETPDELITAMKRRGVRAVKVYPASHNWPLTLDVIGPTLEALERERILTLINFDELPGGVGRRNHDAYEALSTILHALPGLPVLVQNVSWAAQRVITALMTRHENLHIEFSTYQINRGIEEYEKRFGPERLLFGTGLPAKSGGAARAYVDYARVPDEVKAKIAGGNLSRLLGGIVPGAAPPLPADPIRERAARGMPLTGEVHDAHCHVLHRDGQSSGNVVMYRGDGDGLIEICDTMGIRRTAIMSWAGPVASDVVDGNRIVEEAVHDHPDRYLGVAYVNPTHANRDEMMGEIRRLVEREAFVALKPYVFIGLRYDDELYTPCWEYANENGLYVLLHTGGVAGGMETVRNLARRWPDAQWVVAHTGGSFDMARDVAAVMKEHANVWAELTLTPVTNGVIEWLVCEVGDDRILFGTDAPMRDPRPQFGWVVWADLPVESRRKILGENFLRLIGRGAAGGPIA